MAKDSSIEWTHHTFNPWWGCKKVSEACNNCYAEQWAKRMGHKLWGGNSPRRFFSDSHWKEPLTWNDDAVEAGKRARVFCASMSDVFEDRVQLNEPRARLWELIKATPMLDWLLLTKRPENIAAMTTWQDDWPKNVWIGSTVENQAMAEKRLPHLLKIPAQVRFLSCEPLVGALDLSKWFKRAGHYPIDWVIAGGESGPKARPMHPAWAKELLKQCKEAAVPFHFKQWGHWVPEALLLKSQASSRVLEIQMPSVVKMAWLTKKEAGRILEGKTWDGLPAVSNYGSS